MATTAKTRSVTAHVPEQLAQKVDLMAEHLEEFEPRDVRRIQFGHYEMRYEIVDSTIYLLRPWHTREDR